VAAGRAAAGLPHDRGLPARQRRGVQAAVPLFRAAVSPARPVRAGAGGGGRHAPILSNTRRVGERATVFTGPVFRTDDPVYRGVAIPLAYWKVVAFIHDNGRPSASAYLIDQDVNLNEYTLLFGAFKTYQRSVAAIAGLTALDFGKLPLFDGFSNEEAATGTTVRRLITGPQDILL